MRKQKILVTGAAGFIGGHLCERLIGEGYRVVGLDNLSVGTLENVRPEVDFHAVDIRRKNISWFFRDVDAVFHLAAKNCLPDCLASPHEMCDININGTVNVLESSKLHGVKKFVYADSSAVYEDLDDFPSRVEKVAPRGAYAISKHSGAMFAKMYETFFGINVTILRYFNVYGPAQDYRRVTSPVVGAFIMKMLSGENPTIYGDGNKRRDFVHVDDVNDFHLLILKDSRSDGRVFNIGSGLNYSIREIYDLVVDLLGLDMPPKPVYQEELSREAEVTLADISETLELGWKPKTEITDGIRDSVEYLRHVMDKDRNLLAEDFGAI